MNYYPTIKYSTKQENFVCRFPHIRDRANKRVRHNTEVRDTTNEFSLSIPDFGNTTNRHVRSNTDIGNLTLGHAFCTPDFCVTKSKHVLHIPDLRVTTTKINNQYINQ